MFFVGLLPFIGMSQTITVDDTQTVDQLIDGVLVSGDCAEVDNVTSPSNSADSGEGFESFASFDASNATFPFADGIVLATKDVSDIPDGMDFGGGGSLAWPGDPDLEALIQEPGNTNNATVIEFEFTPFVDEINFNYLLASNEWPNFVCTYADTFAFILSGPGISDVNSYNHDANPNTPDLQLDLGGLNIATIPGTNIPVSPVNIHLNDNCGAGTIGEFAVPQLYDNQFSGNGSTEFNGQTEPLSVSTSVMPGETYTIKLAIADRGDTALDSAVFIEGSSFDIGEVDLGPDITLGSDAAVCEGDTITLDAGPGGTSTTYMWFKDFEEIPGEDGQFLDVTESGSYQVAVAFSLDCLQTDSITVEFFPEPELPNGVTAELCAGETVTLDATPQNLSEIENPQYQWSKDGNAITGETNPTITVDEAGTYEIEVNAEACTNITTEFTVNLLDYQVDIVQPTQNCVETGETLEVSADVTGLSSAQQNNLSFEWTYNETTETTETIQLGSTQDVTLTTTINGCERTSTETIEIYTNPEISSLGENIICPGDTSSLDATPDNISNLAEDIEYTWFKDGAEIVGETNAVLQIDEDGTYEVEVDNNGCVTTESIDVNLVEYAIDLGADNTSCTDVGASNSFEIVPTITGIPDSELDQVDYSWSNGETSESIVVDSGGTFSLTTTYLGCTQTDQIDITFIQSLEVDLGPDFKSCFTDQELLTTGLPNDDPDISFTWFRDGSPLPNETSSSLEVEEEGTYEVEVSNQGCISNATITITSYDIDNCTITQGLSPNGDGSNDCLDLTFLNDRTGIDNVQIFNRYGRKVFESNNYVDQFCGQDDDGDRLTTGTYFYVIKLSSEDDEFGRVAKGYIYISEEQ